MKKLMEGFTSIEDSLPEVAKSSPVSSTSEMLVLQNEKGGTIAGFYQRWDRDMNAHHLQAKEGDGYFYAIDGTVLNKVVGWKLAQ